MSLWPLVCYGHCSFTSKRKQKCKLHEVGTMSILLLGLHSVQLVFNYLLNYWMWPPVPQFMIPRTFLDVLIYKPPAAISPLSQMFWKIQILPGVSNNLINSAEGLLTQPMGKEFKLHLAWSSLLTTSLPSEWKHSNILELKDRRLWLCLHFRVLECRSETCRLINWCLLQTTACWIFT